MLFLMLHFIFAAWMRDVHFVLWSRLWHTHTHIHTLTLTPLQYASPATISRCGMVYVDSRNLGYKPYVWKWLTTRKVRPYYGAQTAGL